MDMKRFLHAWRDPLVWIFLLGFGIRLYACLATAIVNPDGLKYLYQAKAIYYQHWSSLTECSVGYVSVLPLLVAAVYPLFHNWVAAGTAITLSFGFAALFPVYGIARRFFDRDIARMVLLIFVFIPALVGRSADIVRGPVYWFFLSMGMLMFVRAFDEDQPRRFRFDLPLSCLCFMLAVWGRVEAIALLALSCLYLVLPGTRRRTAKLFCFLLPALVLGLAGGLIVLLTDTAYLHNLRLEKVLHELQGFFANYASVRADLKSLSRQQPGLLSEFLGQAREALWIVPIGSLVNSMLEKFFYPYVLVYLVGFFGLRARMAADRRVGYFFTLSLAALVILYSHLLYTWLIYDRFLVILILPAVVFVGFGCQKIVTGLQSRFNITQNKALIILACILVLFGLGKNLRPRYEEKLVFREIADAIIARKSPGELTRIASEPSIYYRWVFFYANADYAGVVCDLNLIGKVEGPYPQFVRQARQARIDYLLWSNAMQSRTGLDLAQVPYEKDFERIGEWTYGKSERFVLLRLRPS